MKGGIDAPHKIYSKYDRVSLTALFLLFLAVLIIRLLVKPVIVVGESMNPTYMNGDILMTTTEIRDERLTYGTVVAFANAATANKRYIKRIVAGPGDTVEIKDGVLYVNGTAERTTLDRMENSDMSPQKLLKNRYFVLGDNRNDSVDSRAFGPISVNDISHIIKKRIFSISTCPDMGTTQKYHLMPPRKGAHLQKGTHWKVGR